MTIEKNMLSTTSTYKQPIYNDTSDIYELSYT